MDEWWREQVASGFPAFRGAHVSGSVPIRDQLLNELLQQWLASAAAPTTADASAPRAAAALDVMAFARLVRRAEVRAAEGVVTVDFELGV